MKVDVKDKLILKAVITPASVHDSQAFDELIDVGDCVVYADSACSGAPIETASPPRTSSHRSTRKGHAGIR